MQPLTVILYEEQVSVWYQKGPWDERVKGGPANLSAIRAHWLSIMSANIKRAASIPGQAMPPFYRGGATSLT